MEQLLRKAIVTVLQPVESQRRRNEKGADLVRHVSSFSFLSLVELGAFHVMAKCKSIIQLRVVEVFQMRQDKFS